ncbi:hypothetical protein SAMN05421736_12837 [Evansella caseinilytica]|uniref:Uncharacterized protein n=1 Tax=Evansella caseinilytica TaxID=1503961 RepID=A0A1H3UWU5_9BACI|nr:hypothetical protein SAMN05421736_12837 [Evansella caseinilytica]
MKISKKLTSVLLVGGMLIGFGLPSQASAA